MPKIIPALSVEARIRRGIRLHLRDLGFARSTNGTLLPPTDSKEAVRALHGAQRESLLADEREFIKREWGLLSGYFANGSEVDAQRVSPRLEPISADTWQSRLFRLASLTWSVPVSQGYGRRMRFLVWDDQNGKLLGLIALGDPVFNLKARDEYIGWTAAERRLRLVNVLDAYVLGAIPPYNLLLGGKLVACLVRTREVRDLFAERYAHTRGIISHARKNPSLVFVSTSSALGRSSIYNRLILAGRHYFEPIGFTSGWGHFHIPDRLFVLIRDYLRAVGHRYADNHRYGDGPNWKLRAVRQALTSLGLNADLLRHGIGREVFVCELAANAKRFLAGKVKHPRYDDLMSVPEVSALARDRWIEPRAIRRPDFLRWRREALLEVLKPAAARSTKARRMEQSGEAGDGACQL